MKKSKVIIPAIAVLALSGTAAVTGTYAWFEANRSVKLTGTVGVVNTEGNLTVALTPGKGTSVLNKAVTFKKFSDGSLDLSSSSPVAYKKNNEPQEEPGNEYIAMDGATPGQEWNDKKISASEDAWRAQSFVAKFSLPESTASSTYALFLDGAATKIVKQDNEKIAKALRIGFKTTAEWAVTAPSANRTLAAKTIGDTYVSGIAANSGEGTKNPTQYVTDNVVSKTNAGFYSDGKFLDSVTNTAATTATNYIGTFNATHDIDVTFYVWFEGTDAQCTKEGIKTLESAAYDIEISARIARIIGD